MSSANPADTPLVRQALAKNNPKTCSLQELEALAVYLHGVYWAAEKSLKIDQQPGDMDILRHIKKAPSLNDILRERKRRLNHDFKFTPKTIARFVKINALFVDCLKKAHAEAKPIRQRLARRLKNRDSFIKDFEIEIRLAPFTHKPGIHEVLEDIIHDAPALLTQNVREPSNARRNLNRLNWNECDGLSHGELAEHRICYAMHELYDHSYWSLPDILKIKQVWADVIVTRQHFADVTDKK